MSISDTIDWQQIWRLSLEMLFLFWKIMKTLFVIGANGNTKTVVFFLHYIILPIEDNVCFWEPQKPCGYIYTVAFFSLQVEAKSHFPRIATGLVLALTGLILSTKWPFAKTRPPLVTVAMCNKPCRSNTTHNVLTQLKIHCGSKEETDRSRLL